MVESPFCQKCGSLVSPKRKRGSRKFILWCANCKMEIESTDETKMFQERISIEHKPQDFTRILEEDEPPPVPKIFSQSYKERRKKRCRHPNAVFKGFYQFSRGDEASRKYWWCPDCAQLFRFSGRMDIRPGRRIIADKTEKDTDKKK